MSKSTAPASADPPGRSRGIPLRPWALLGVASACSVGAVPADGALRNMFIGLAGAQAAVAFGVLADRTIHPRWLWSNPRIFGKRSYESFPYRKYFRWVAHARHRVVIIDTVCHLVSDPERVGDFFISIRKALKNGAIVDYAPYCPCCPLLTERGKQLGRSNREVRDLAERQYTEIDQFLGTLTDAERGRFHVWPHRKLLTYVEYRCDERVLRSYLEGKESQSCEHKLYSASSDEGRTCEEALAEIKAVSGADSFFELHMRGVLKVGDQMFPGVRYIVDYSQPRRPVTYLALTDKKQINAAIAAAIAGVPVTWRQGSSTPAKYILEPRKSDFGGPWPMETYQQRYRVNDKPSFFRLAYCRSRQPPVPSP